MSGDSRRLVAPAAFLLAVTIAVVLVRSGLQKGGGSATPTTTVSTPRKHVATTTTTTTRTTTKAAPKYWTVRAGDTYGSISAQTGVAVATLEQLNPSVSSTALFIGERIRIR